MSWGLLPISIIKLWFFSRNFCSRWQVKWESHSWKSKHKNNSFTCSLEGLYIGIVKVILTGPASLVIFPVVQRSNKVYIGEGSVDELYRTWLCIIMATKPEKSLLTYRATPVKNLILHVECVLSLQPSVEHDLLIRNCFYRYWVINYTDKYKKYKQEHEMLPSSCATRVSFVIPWNQHSVQLFHVPSRNWLWK